MMIPNYVYLIIAGVFGLSIWLFRVWINGLEAKVKCLEEQTVAQEFEISDLKSKLWSEKKLTEHIDKSVRSAMTEVILNWYKDGIIPVNR